MIDPRDPGTQQLQLEQKRGRGRPTTGQALSNAERQRRYREAKKAQRNENMHKAVAEDMRAELAKALEQVETAEMRTRVEFELGEKARERVRELEAQLAQRNKNTAHEELKWSTQYRLKGDRKWMTSKSYGVRAGTEDARQFIDDMNKKDAQTSWRCVSTTGLIYDPKALK